LQTTNQPAKVKLFCLPHAGGSATSYRSWQKLLGESIELRPIELAGRGKRNNEPLYQNMEEAIEDVFNKISSEIDEMPYAILGHSMGTVIAHGLALMMIKHKRQSPVHIFFSGRNPPDQKRMLPKINILPDEEFLVKFIELGGISSEILENEELLAYVLPILRADTAIVENYIEKQPIQKLNCNITVFSGKQDQTTSDAELMAWTDYTHKSCRFHSFDGGHFFINVHKASIAKIIQQSVTLV